ncbi:hypothetical protein BJ546DRAFT_946803 [Cryomyces antarcticus]
MTELRACDVWDRSLPTANSMTSDIRSWALRIMTLLEPLRHHVFRHHTPELSVHSARIEDSAISQASYGTRSIVIAVAVAGPRVRGRASRNLSSTPIPTSPYPPATTDHAASPLFPDSMNDHFSAACPLCALSRSAGFVADP